jgi:hypothetical protein
LSLAGAQSPEPAATAVPRYSVQYCAQQGKLPLYFITDNATEKLHIYENGAKGCVLRQVIDLGQTGQAEMIATRPDPVAARPEEAKRR